MISGDGTTYYLSDFKMDSFPVISMTMSSRTRNYPLIGISIIPYSGGSELGLIQAKRTTEKGEIFIDQIEMLKYKTMQEFNSALLEQFKRWSLSSED